jgi:hypothetical protein
MHSRLPELARELYDLAREASIRVPNCAVRKLFFRRKTAQRLLLQIIYILIENGLLDDRHRKSSGCASSSQAKSPNLGETTECLPQPACASGRNFPIVALDCKPSPGLVTTTPLASKLQELQEKPAAETEKPRPAAAPQLPPKPQGAPPALPATAPTQAPSLSKSETEEPAADATKRYCRQEAPDATAFRTRVQLPPGSVGKPYSRQLEAPDLTNFHEVKARGLEEIG